LLQLVSRGDGAGHALCGGGKEGSFLRGVVGGLGSIPEAPAVRWAVLESGNGTIGSPLWSLRLRRGRRENVRVFEVGRAIGACGPFGRQEDNPDLLFLDGRFGGLLNLRPLGRS
jgi:hypothetical protein